MNYIGLWLEDIRARPSLTLKSSLQVQALHDKHLGPRSEYAKVDILFEPAPQFEVVTQVDVGKGYVNSIVFGLLDILLASGQYPLKDIRVVIKGIETDPINSSQMAFRLAGRRAGMLLMESLEQT